MSERPSSKARFWETLQQREPVEKEPVSLEPPTDLSDLAKRCLEILSSIEAATLFELRVRLGVESEEKVESAAEELRERGIVGLSTRGTDVVVSLLG